MDKMGQLPDAGMKFPNSIGEGNKFNSCVVHQDTKVLSSSMSRWKPTRGEIPGFDNENKTGKHSRPACYIVDENSVRELDAIP
jgi:hypothetical protein